MKYDFDKIPERRETDSIKWRKYDPDVLPMWVADMDFLSPRPVIQALRERVEQGIFGYPQEPPELKEVIVKRLAERYAWEVQPEDLILLPGVVKGFNLACHALADPGEGALIQTPVYFPFLEAPGNAGLARQEMELSYNPELGTNGQAYSMDPEAFEAAITPETRLFILCNPHNPIGRVYQREELEKMAQACLRHKLVICSDEIHCDLIYSGCQHIPIATLDPEIAQNTITLMAPSKTFNLPGLQCSVAIIQNPELRKKFDQARKGLVSWVNTMGMIAALAAYRDGGDWLDQILVYLESNRDYLYEYVRTELPGLRMKKPEGTYLAWLDCRQASIEGNPYEFFLERGRVALNDGATFGRGGEGFVRLNFGCPRATLTQALDRMKKALDVHS
jgi:cystathionine beta-lyase